jgi:hypothetical protein
VTTVRSQGHLIQAGDAGGLDHKCGKNGGKSSETQCVFKVNSIGFADTLDLETNRKGEVEGDSCVCVCVCVCVCMCIVEWFPFLLIRKSTRVTDLRKDIRVWFQSY